MALYTALIYLPATEYWTDQPEQVHRPSDGYELFAAEAGAAGVMQGGQALYPPEMATTITVSGGKGGDVIVTDGPYAEAKEVLGGFFLLEAADLDEATKWASKIPASWNGGKVELRPVVPMQE